MKNNIPSKKASIEIISFEDLRQEKNVSKE